MAPPNNPEAEDVMNQIGDLPRTGVVAQDSTGMIYLDIDDDFIFKALEVLRPFGYIRPAFFVFPPAPIGAHIKIVTKREAEDYEVRAEMRDIPHIGQRVNFQLVKAYVSYPRVRQYGVEARYKIRVESPELDRIRKDLTGLQSPLGSGFFILLAVRNIEIMESLEKYPMIIEDDDEDEGNDMMNEDDDEEEGRDIMNKDVRK